MASLLDDNRYAVLATARGDGRAHAAPVAFVMADGSFWIATVQGLRLRNLRAIPWASVVVMDGDADEDEEGTPHRALTAEGPVVLHDVAYSRASRSNGSTGTATHLIGPQRSSSCARSGSSRMRPVRAACVLVPVPSCSRPAPRRRPARRTPPGGARAEQRDGRVTRSARRTRACSSPRARRRASSSVWSRSAADRATATSSRRAGPAAAAGSGLHPPRYMTLPSGTVTFLFTDIEGSTELVRRLRERYHEVLGEHQRIVREAVTEAGGTEIDTQGDSFFFVFRRAREAVLAAANAQRVLAAHDWPEDGVIRVRMGIHTGEAAAVDGRYVGVAVHRAARISAAGHGGQVLLSQTTHNLLEDEEELPLGLARSGRAATKGLRPARARLPAGHPRASRALPAAHHHAEARAPPATDRRQGAKVAAPRRRARRGRH